MTPDEPDLDGTISWRELLAEVTGALGGVAAVEAPSIEARWIVEEASGLEGAEWVLGLDDLATQRGVAHLDSMVQRRASGVPIQYVLGHWPFRTLDLLVDERVLIPRPETEQVVEHALAELDRLAPAPPPPASAPFSVPERPISTRSAPRTGAGATVVDLGTGSGAIGLAIAVERPKADVWITDRSVDALAVARANLAGLGMAGRRVRVAEGDWFDALDPSLAGNIELLVSNPPYVADDEELAPSVRDHEPAEALVPGPTGLEAYEVIVAGAATWLAPGGSLVVEIGHTQADAVSALADAAGLVNIRVAPDLAGLDRALIARRP